MAWSQNSPEIEKWFLNFYNRDESIDREHVYPYVYKPA